MGNVLKFPRKRRQSLAERAVELAKQRTTEQLQSELAVNLSEAFKARREHILAEREPARLMSDPVFAATMGLL